MKLSERIVDAAGSVNDELMPGLRENAYHKALLVELGRRQMVFSTEVTIPIHYHDMPVAFVRPDLVVGDSHGAYRIVELKAGRDGSDQAERYLNIVRETEYNWIDGATAISFGETVDYTHIER